MSVAAVVTTSPDAAAAGGNLAYYGGHVISHVQVVPVMWGSSVAPDVASRAEAFYAAIVDSPYIDWLGEYDTAGLKGKADNLPGSNQHIDRGKVLPTVVITPGKTGTSLADADIQAELLAQIKAGKLPAPQTDAEGGVDTLYMISFPRGTSIRGFDGSDVCSGACAYHWTVTVPGIASGVPYGVIPDCSSGQSQCALGTGVFDTFTGDASHELVEAMTDPECALDTSSTVTQRPIGWFDPSAANGEGEVADLCLSDPSAWVTYLGYLVQKNWSQRLGQCITNDPKLTLCDGHTRPCRPCTSADCSGATPTCDTDVSSPTWGVCVASGGSSGGGSSGSGGSSGGSGSGGSSSGASSGGSSGSDGSGSGSSGGAPSGDSPSPRNGDGGVAPPVSGCACGVARPSAPGGAGVAVWLAGLAAVVRARTRRRSRAVARR